MKVAVLVISILVGGQGSINSRGEFASMENCLKALKEVKLVIPNGAENESAGAAFCTWHEKAK